jgi:FixJ family two-component response regulator
LVPKRQKIVAIVEDDASMLRAAGALLDAHGFATLAFASAEEFLARGAAKQVDCLLLDIDLGGSRALNYGVNSKVSVQPFRSFS